MTQRPALDEMDPYFHTYLTRVPDADATVDAALARSREASAAVFSGVDESRADHRYAPDKWSIKELVGHLIDCERMFCVRALAFAREDPTELPGFDHDHYVATSRSGDRPWADLIAELDAVRTATRALFGSFDDETLRRRGVANGASISVRALGYIMAGHERHHAGVVAERYL